MTGTLSRPTMARWARPTLALALGLLGATAGAQTTPWPTRTISFVVPFAPGTATDVLARTLAESMAKDLNAPIVVENKAGASASIGASAVAKATPDGYTILVGSSTTHAANSALFTKLSYDPVKDFVPISLLGEIPQVMVVNPSVPVNTATEFVAYAKGRSEKLTYAQGSSGNLIPAAVLSERNKLGMVMVGYRSPPPALLDVMGGTVPMMFADMSASLSNIQSGKLKAIAVTSREASPLLPNVAPLSQTATMEGFELTSWIAMWAPVGTPNAVVDRLNKSAHAALKDPAVAQRLHRTGFNILMSTPTELGALVVSETIKWGNLVKEAGIQPQ